METLLYKRNKISIRNSATPKGEPLARWMESGSPVEKMLDINEPRSEERNWMTRRRMMGKRRRPMGLSSSEMASVMAWPWSPRRSGAATTMQTTKARRMPCGGAALRSSIILGAYVPEFLPSSRAYVLGIRAWYCVFLLERAGIDALGEEKWVFFFFCPFFLLIKWDL